MRLTGPNVARLTLPPGKSEMIVFDDALPGFGVRIRAGGKRVWIAQYRIGQKQRRLTIASVDTLSAEKARAHAKDVLAKVQLGADPQTEKSEGRARAAVTLGAVSRDYLNGPAKKRLRERSFEEVERHFQKHWKPLHELPIHKLTRAEVASRLNSIAKESGPFAANRARASLSALFGWAMREGIVEANPVIGTNKATAEVSRDRVLTEAELADVWACCGDDDYGRIVRLLILTGQRREEVGGMRWPEIHKRAALWSLPKERTKNGLPHEVPLSDLALSIIEGVTAREDRDLIFGAGEGAFQGWSSAKRKLDERIAERMKNRAKDGAQKFNQMPAWRLHDIRRTVATRMSEMGVLPHVVEAILNHVSGHRAGVAGVYNRATYGAEKRQSLTMWSKHIFSEGL